MGQTIACAKSMRVDRHLQILGRPEGDFLARFDLYRFSRCGIAPHASSPLSDLENAKTCKTDAFALLEMLCDKTNKIAEEGLTSPFRQLMLLGQGRCKMLERNGTARLSC
jgi:hypothetical protein